MKRILGLDILRTIAIMQVVLVHSTYAFPDHIKNQMLLAIPAWDGVSIFFVLSGFLIGGILLRLVEQGPLTKHILFQFWLQRWFRTIPNYVLVMMILFLYDILIYRTPSLLTAEYFVFTQNFASNHPDFFPEAWSLSVEEWFYMLYPLSCYIGLKLASEKKRVILFSAFLFIVVPLVLRIINNAQGNPEHLVLRKIVLFRLDSLMYGIIGAYIYRYYRNFWRDNKRIALFASFSLVLVLEFLSLSAYSSRSFVLVYISTIEALATLLMLPFLSEVHEIKWTRLAAVFTFVSAISYSMYVLNLSVVAWRIIPALVSLSGIINLDPITVACISFVLFWPLLFVSSYLLHRFYEVPMMNLRDKVSIRTEF